MKKIALIGIGPHAKRIHLNFFKKHKINLSLVVELESKKEETKKYLDEHGFKNTLVYTIDDSYKDDEHLPQQISKNLLYLCKTLKITHIIISTEPKAHYMYIEFGLKNDFQVLTDKPISVVKDMTNIKSIEKIRTQYYKLLNLAHHSKGSCKVMCQRQYHRGYEEIKKILEKTIDRFKVPITNIEIFYSDGAWEMPHDLEKENHPYKYGYGELFHSGYHFINLLSDLIKMNDSLGHTKKIETATIYSQAVTPNDELEFLTIEDYKRIFAKQIIPSFYRENKNPIFNRYGEKDYHGLFTFRNKEGFTITTANMNLIHNGVSQRSWIKTKDFYKNNGRIRHERIDIHIAHLLNVQVHSYQSKEISQRTDHEETIGGLEHFDIYFFHNPLVDKKPFKEIHLGDLYTSKEKKNFQGYNELAREEFIKNFLSNRCKGDLEDQALSIEMLYACAKGIHNKYTNHNRVEKIDVRNEYTHRFIAKRLKNYSRPIEIDLEKKTLSNSINHKDIYTFYNFLKYIPQKDEYEVFISIDDSKNIAGSLLAKTFKSKGVAKLYYNYLEYLIKNKKVSSIERFIEKHCSRTI